MNQTSSISLGSVNGYQTTIYEVPYNTSSEKQDYDEAYFHDRYKKAVQQMGLELSKTAKIGKFFKPYFSEQQYSLKRMNDRYSREKIKYFTKRGLEDIQVYVINGLIYNKDLQLYNSSVELKADAGGGEMIVMDRLGNLFIAPKVRGIYHHSSFFSGGPVAFAGLCYIKEGRIENLVRYSGHYSPEEKEENSFSEQLNTTQLVEKLWIESNIPRILLSKLEDQAKQLEAIVTSNVEDLNFPAKAAIFSRTGAELIKVTISILSTREEALEIIMSQYLKIIGKKEIPEVRDLTIAGSHNWCSGKRAADYLVLPGQETLIWIFLA